MATGILRKSNRTPRKYMSVITLGKNRLRIRWFLWPETLQRISFDKKALGLNGKNLRYTDLWTGKEMTESELESRMIPGNHFLLVGVKAE